MPMTLEQARESTDPKIVQSVSRYDALKIDSAVYHSLVDLDGYQVQDLGDRRYRSIIFNDESDVRHFVQIQLDGMAFSDYQRNPVVLYAHGLTEETIPIARTVVLDKPQPHLLRAEFEFLTGDPFVDRVHNAWSRGFLRAASISWWPRDLEFGDDGSIIVTQSDLVEWSIVPVGADPAALGEGYSQLVNFYLTGKDVPPQQERTVIFDTRADGPEPELPEPKLNQESNEFVSQFAKKVESMKIALVED